MARRRKLEIDILGDASSARRAFNQLDNQTDSFGRRMGRWAKGLAATVAAGFAVDQIINFSGEMLSLQAQVEAWGRKVDTVFEDQAGTVRAWADDLNERFGLTDDNLAGLAASFGDLLKPMGFTAAEAADMSMEVVGLAGALSEWTGGQRSAADVADTLAKAMLGEREELKGLGISISEAEVQQRILDKGQQDLTGTARQMAEAIATQELIFEKSKDAQKAYAEGGNEALQAQNNLKAAVGELKEELAERLAPVLTDITMWIGDNLIPTLEDLWGWIEENVIPVLQRLKTTFEEDVIPAMQAMWEFTEREILPVLQDLWATIREDVIPAFERLADALFGSKGRAEEASGAFELFWGLLIGFFTFLQTLAQVFHFLAQMIAIVVDWVGRAIAFFKPFGRLLSGDVAGALGTVVGWLKAVVDWINHVIRRLAVMREGIRAGASAPSAAGSGGGLAGKVLDKLFADGGVVYAASGFVARGTDTVPAMLTPGEMVLNDQQQANLWNLINGGAGGGATLNVNVYPQGHVLSERDLIGAINRAVSKGIKLAAV